MSLLGTLSMAGSLAQGSGLFGGSSTGSKQNIARGFSSSCGIFPPVSQGTANQAKRTANPCQTARNIASGRGVMSIPGTVPRVPIPTGIPEFDVGGVLAAVTGSGSAQAGVVGVAARAAFSPAFRRQVVAFAKKFGIQLAATMFGISLFEAADMVARPPKRRRRGITAAQLANARRVNCKIQSMAKTLGMTCSGRKAPARRAASCR